jgi:hypothetical protein
MKLRIFAVIAAIASITFATPVKADTVASLQLVPQQTHQQTQENLTCSATTPQPLDQFSFAIASAACESWNSNKETTPVKVAVLASESVYKFAPISPTFHDLADRVVMLSHQSNIACLVNGGGSVNGSVTCGFVDVD